MNIFQVISENLRSGPVTLRFPTRVTPAKGYRGLVKMDPERCVGCAACAYVCASRAIQVNDCATQYEWCYEPGGCTFCGRCIEVCPTGALEMDGDRPRIYTREGELRVTHLRPYPVCPECGRPAHPVNEALLALAFDEISAEIRAWSRLCENCRARQHHTALVDLYGAEKRI
jgi:formate hydrogenlyase subunit 6/NADH:ubiquinone oxidoreductase subunit I